MKCIFGLFHGPAAGRIVESINEIDFLYRELANHLNKRVEDELLYLYISSALREEQNLDCSSVCTCV